MYRLIILSKRRIEGSNYISDILQRDFQNVIPAKAGIHAQSSGFLPSQEWRNNQDREQCLAVLL